MTRRRAVGEGSIYFDEDKQRWVGAISVGGRRRKVLATTKTEARRRLDALRRNAAAGEPIGDGNITVADVLERWQRRALAGKDVAPSTRETYAWCCSRLEDEIGSARLRTFNVEDLEAALDRMSMGSSDDKPLSRAALIKIRSVLGQALDFAMRRGLVARNVARIAELTPTAKRTEPRRALKPDQARVLLAAFDNHRLGAMFTIMLTVGLRPGEAAGLCWDDVEVDLGRVAIRRSVQLVRGSPALVDALKTTRSRRTIDLPSVAADALRHHRKFQLEERLAATTWADDRLVFATSRGTVLSPANVRRDLAGITESLGLGVWCPNELRHTAASLLSDAGVALEHVADLLGHTNTRMLEQTYRHSIQPSTRAAVAPMDKILGKARDAS